MLDVMFWEAEDDKETLDQHFDDSFADHSRTEKYVEWDQEMTASKSS